MRFSRHDGIGVDRDGKAIGHESDALLDPASAMFERQTAVGVDAAENWDTHNSTRQDISPRRNRVDPCSDAPL
jgi:hypothetical protein